MLVSSRKAIRTSNRTVCRVLSSASVRLPRVFSASTPSKSMVVRAPRMSTLRTLSLLRARPHLNHRGDVKLLHQVLEADLRRRAHGGVLRPHHLLQPLRRGVVGRLLLAALLGRGRRGNSASASAAASGVAAGAGSRRASDFDSLTTSRGPPPDAAAPVRFCRSRRLLLALLLFFRLHLAAVNHFKLRFIAHGFPFPI